MTNFESLLTPQKLRAAIHRDTKPICTETCHLLGLDITKQSMEIIAELVHKKLAYYGADLEAFAKHAKRQTINADDVKLLVRRNPSLLSHLTDLAGNTAAKEKRRKTVAPPVAKQPQTPAAPKPKESSMQPVVTEKNSESDDIANMIVDVDEMIDLTFD